MTRLTLAALVTFALAAIVPAQKTVRVFILAGQSNMEGKAQNALLERQAEDGVEDPLYEHWRKGSEWVERDDVFVDYLGRRGPLTIGYGSRNRTGAELEFGRLVGDHFKEPVLLIKTAWGGKSLVRDFRSPSAGMPSEEKLEKEFEQLKKNRAKRNQPEPTMDEVQAAYGHFYRSMLEEVQTSMRECSKRFPQLKGRKPVIEGFVWFQGWNDQYNGAELEYGENLAHFVRDVRRDLKTPELPVVIAAMGQHGSKPVKGAMKAVQEAQLAIAKQREFRGNVASIRTDDLVDEAAEELFPRWKQERERWDRIGSDRPYHYLGSAIWFGRIGRRMAETLIPMVGVRSPGDGAPHEGRREDHEHRLSHATSSSRRSDCSSL